jgi:predicted RNase H-like HicB family nuclease
MPLNVSGVRPSKSLYSCGKMNTQTVAMNITVTAAWDPEAGVWYVEDSNVPGLSTGADTLDELVEKLKVVVPELLAENGVPFKADTFKVETNVAA